MELLDHFLNKDVKRYELTAFFPDSVVGNSRVRFKTLKADRYQDGSTLLLSMQADAPGWRQFGYVLYLKPDLGNSLNVTGPPDSPPPSVAGHDKHLLHFTLKDKVSHDHR